MIGPRNIANKELTQSDIPPVDADWDTIAEFALTFDGYEVWGSSDKCADIANARRHGSLTELRTCLFFAQRRWRHFNPYRVEPGVGTRLMITPEDKGNHPDKEAMDYVRDVVEQIRARVVAGDIV